MTKTNTQRELRKIRELARDYESKGFHVSVEPRGSAVPAFLRKLEFSPDLVAESDEESHVIEVSSRDTAERLRELSPIVDAIEKKRGWNFILVMTNPRTPSGAPSATEAPSLDELQASLENVKELSVLSTKSENRFTHAVLLSAWAVVEGALRMYLYTGKPEKQPRSPRSIVRDAVMYGFITATEGNFLDSIAQIRNSVAHGAVNTKVPAKTLSRLLSLCDSLVS